MKYRFNTLKKADIYVIFLVFNYVDKRLEGKARYKLIRISTGIKLRDKKHLLLNKQSLSSSHAYRVRDGQVLDRFDSAAKKTRDKYLSSGERPSKEVIKKEIQDIINGKTTDKTIFDAMNILLDQYKGSDSGKRQKVAVYRKLKSFGGIELAGLSIGLVEKFKDSLVEGGLASYTVNQYISELKSVLRFCKNKGWTNFDVSLIKAPRYKRKEGIYLNESEIEEIKKVNLMRKNHQIAKDFILIGLLTGLRFSDWQIKKEWIIKRESYYEINILTKKRKTKACVPVSKTVLEIFKKYNFELPEKPKLRTINLCFRKLGKLAGFEEKIFISTSKNGIIVQLPRPKHELLTSHVCRASFITNITKEGNVSDDQVMLMTGISDSKTLITYKRVTPQENAKDLANNEYFSL